MNDKKKVKDFFVKIMAVVGVVAILSLSGFFTVTVLTKSSGFFSGIAAQAVSITQRFISTERIIVNLSNETPEDGEEVLLSFEHLSKKEDGSYSFFYECRQGVHFEKDETIIFCNTPYDFINSDNTLSFNVFSSVTDPVNVFLSINFVRNNSNRISERGEATIKINASAGNVEDGGIILVTDNSGNNKPTTTPRTPGKKVEETFLFDERSGSRTGISDPNGKVDLRPIIIDIGKVDKITNEFTATSTVRFADRGAIKFEVENIGTKISPSWTFNVVVPTFPSFIYHSKNQQPLLPGDRIEYIIGFDSMKNDNKPNIIIVNVDPIRSINESDETNNIVKRELKVF